MDSIAHSCQHRQEALPCHRTPQTEASNPQRIVDRRDDDEPRIDPYPCARTSWAAWRTGAGVRIKISEAWRNIGATSLYTFCAALRTSIVAVDMIWRQWNAAVKRSELQVQAGMSSCRHRRHLGRRARIEHVFKYVYRRWNTPRPNAVTSP